MNETDAPVRHQPRRRCIQDILAVPKQPDLADQTTARLHALNETIRELRTDLDKLTGLPFSQTQFEPILKSIKANMDARNEVYAEIARLVGPAELIAIDDKAVAAAAYHHAQERRAGETSEESIGGPHGGL